jgi:hypothetical protein
MSDKNDELRELCAKVYEVTIWDDDSLRHWLGDEIFDRRLFQSDTDDEHPESSYCPLYTSDYILVNLPNGIKGNYINIFNAGINSWYALYGRTTTAKDTGLYGESSTPLKALLKLTIALDNAGELPTKDEGGE